MLNKGMSLAPDDFRSRCPIASSLDIVGDRWTLVLVRDLYFGASRYSALLSSPEGIPTNLLAKRLKTLEARGIVTKQPYQTHPKRYEYALTAMGRSLYPVLKALSQWGLEWLPGRKAALPGDVAWVRRAQGEVNSLMP